MNQMDSPLTLHQYFFPCVEVTADPQAEFKENHEYFFETKVNVLGPNEDKLYQVNLEISSFPEDEDTPQPYAIRLIAVGVFHVSEKWDNPMKLLRVNGASILFSSAREFLITITARGPWGAVSLPVLSFLQKYIDEFEGSDDKSPQEVKRDD